MGAFFVGWFIVSEISLSTYGTRIYKTSRRLFHRLCRGGARIGVFEKTSRRRLDDEGGETYYNGNTNLAGDICVIFTILQGQSPNEN